MRNLKKIIFITLNLLIIILPVKGYCEEAGDISCKEKKEIEKVNETEFKENINDGLEETIDKFEVDNVTYKLIDNDTVMFLKYTEPDKESILKVPNYVVYNKTKYKVDYIYEKAFNKACSSEPEKCMINKIIISDKVKGFCDDEGNKQDRVNSIFKEQRKLKEVEFGNIDVQWGYECFFKCQSLKSVDIPENISILFDSTFLGCSSLEEINLENIREFKGGEIFEDCISLRNIGRLNDNVKVLTENMFNNCRNLQISDINNVVEIEDNCFFNCKKLNDTVVKNIITIGERSFSGCSSFNNVKFNCVEYIGKEAFSNCPNLTEVVFEGSVCPDIKDNIDKFVDSNIAKYTFPAEYASQFNYNNFLKSLSIKCTYVFDDYKGKPQTKRSYRDSLYVLYDFKPVEYKLLNWCKDEELTMKVENIADTGIIEGEKVIIENPIVFGNCVEKINEGNYNLQESNSDQNNGYDTDSKNDKWEEGNNCIQSDDYTRYDKNEMKVSDKKLDNNKEDLKNIDIDNDKNGNGYYIDMSEVNNKNQESNKHDEADSNELRSNSKQSKDNILSNNTVSSRKARSSQLVVDTSSKNKEKYKIIIIEKSRLKPGINRFYISNHLLKNNYDFLYKRMVNIYCDYKELCNEHINKIIVRYYYDKDKVETEWAA